MKKTIQWLGMVVMSSALWAQANVTINWSATDLSSDSDVGSELQAGWLVGLYQDVNGDNTGDWYDQVLVDVSDGSVISSGVTSDDIFLGVQRDLLDINDGNGTLTLNPLDNAATLANNSSVYSVFFNASSIAAATEVAATGDIGDPFTPFNVGTPDAVNTKYNLGNDIASTSFHAIPEPGVASLLAVFGVGTFFMRRVFRPSFA